MPNNSLRTTEYSTGTHVAIAGPSGSFLGTVEAASLIVTALWDLLCSETAPEQIAALARDSGLTDFAVLAETDEGVVLLLAGAARAETGSIASEAVSGGASGGVPTSEVTCPSGARYGTYVLEPRPGWVALRVGPPGDAPSRALLPLAGGVVAACALVTKWDQTRTPPTPEGPTSPTTTSSVAEVSPPVDEAPPPLDEAPSQIGEAALPAAHVPSPPVARAVLEAPEDTILPGMDDGAVSPDAEGTSQAEPVGGQPIQTGGDAGDLSAGYDHLFGRTINRTVEDAAIRAVAEADQSPAPQAPSPDPAASTPEPPPAVTTTPAAPPPVRPPVTAPSAGMIDSVPWAEPATSAHPSGAQAGGMGSPRSSIEMEAEHDLTIQRGAHKALLRQMAEPGHLAALGPTVHAVRCPAGHLNPPHLVSCRVCSAAVSEQPPVTVPRPVLGVLRLSSGDDIVLDRSVLLGRSPSVDRLVDGERPHVVKLPSPGQDISRNHVEVHVDGWHVLVTDLNSTNGTVVTRVGQLPERLRPNDAAMIEPGTVVTIADEVSFTFVAR